VAEEKAKLRKPSISARGKAEVSYGVCASMSARATPLPSGARCGATRENNSWSPGFLRSRLPSQRADKQRQFLRVEEGTYENGVFKWSASGMATKRLEPQFRVEPVVLRRFAGDLLTR